MRKIGLVIILVSIISLCGINNVFAARLDNIPTNALSINKVDQNGNPISGASFEISEISYTVALTNFNKMEGCVTNDGIYMASYVIPSVLSPTSDTPEYSYVLVKTSNNIYLKDGMNISVVDFLDGGAPICGSHIEIVISDIISEEIGEYYSILKISEGEAEEIIDWDKTLDGLYICSASIDSFDACVNDATRGEGKLSDTQYSMNGDTVFKYNSAFKIILPVKTIRNAKPNEVIESYSARELLTYLSDNIILTEISQDYIDDAGYVIIEEIEPPTNYMLSNHSVQTVDTKTVKDIVFINNKIKDENSSSEPEINVPNTGEPTSKTNAILIPVSIIGTSLGAIFIAILPKLHHKKITFKK